MAKEKKAFEESLRRFQEKGAALKAALETSQKSAAGNMAALKAKHKVTLPPRGARGAFGPSELRRLVGRFYVRVQYPRLPALPLHPSSFCKGASYAVQRSV